MKKNITIIVIAFCVSISFSYAQQGLELGQRYLKLGNSYLMSGELEKAQEYLEKGQKVVNSVGNQYWKAVSNEYLGYLALEKGDKEKAMELLSKALKGYNDIINQDDGSPVAIQHIIDKLEELGGDTFITNDNNVKIGVYNYDNLKKKEFARIGVIPDDAYSVSMRHIKMKNFPSRLLGISNLRFIDLTDNKIDRIPENIHELSNLEYLNLSENDLDEIPVGALSKMKHLKMLNLQGNDIPFTMLANLIRNLPNTNIQHDKYELIDEAGNEMDFDAFLDE